eukprot:ctg_2867.g483
MAKYFHAYRIDHILGFFRIWEIPGTARSGLAGRFRPVLPLQRHELESRGLWDIERLCEPYISDKVLRELFGDQRLQAIRQKYFEPWYDPHHPAAPVEQRGAAARFRPPRRRLPSAHRDVAHVLVHRTERQLATQAAPAVRRLLLPAAGGSVAPQGTRKTAHDEVRHRDARVWRGSGYAAQLRVRRAGRSVHPRPAGAAYARRWRVWRLRHLPVPDGGHAQLARHQHCARLVGGNARRPAAAVLGQGHATRRRRTQRPGHLPAARSAGRGRQAASPGGLRGADQRARRSQPLLELPPALVAGAVAGQQALAESDRPNGDRRQPRAPAMNTPVRVEI